MEHYSGTWWSPPILLGQDLNRTCEVVFSAAVPPKSGADAEVVVMETGARRRMWLLIGWEAS